MMWEQIRSNRTKTAILVLSMAAVLFTLGWVIAEAYVQDAGVYGILIAGAIWFFLTTVAYFQGDHILLAVSGAHKIEKADHPELFNVVEEMKIASGLSHMPGVYVINDNSMNAFATGRKPKRCAVAVTSGLLKRLNRDELQGVIGHEVAHIVNRDVLLMSMVGVLLGAIVMISEIYLRAAIHGAGGSSRYGSSSSRRGGGGPMIILAIVLAILAPILAQFIYFAISRRREYLADASSAVFTRYPEGLASALELLGSSALPVARANKATAAMYIVNPFAKVSLSALTSTHPPVEERIRILRSMGGKVSYRAYQQAWTGVGRRNRRFPQSALANDSAVAARAASATPVQRSPREKAREVGDMLRKINGFLFLPCACGLTVKVPPDSKRPSINCPRCNRILAVPVAQIQGAAEILDRVPGAEPPPIPPDAGGIRTAKARTVLAAAPLKIIRRPGEWQTFKCSCGAAQTISPGLLATQTKCNQCGRTILIESA